MSVSFEDAKARYPGADSFKFGDSRELCTRLISLVRAGKKRATCGALKSFHDSDKQMPEVGNQYIALDWDGHPALLIETTEVTIRTFSEVDADFALAEGEGETLEGWQAGHKAYFERNGCWRPDMELICERFTLLEDFAHTFK